MSITRLKHIRCIVEPPADPEGSGTEDEPKENEPRSRAYTQAEIDEIVAKRVARVKKQYGDYEDMKKKAAKFDEIEAANKSELEKLADQNQKLAAQLAEREHAALIQAACIKHGVPADCIDLVTGADEESIDKAAETRNSPRNSPNASMRRSSRLRASNTVCRPTALIWSRGRTRKASTRRPRRSPSSRPRP